MLTILRKLATLLTSSQQIDQIQRFADENGLNTSQELKAALDNARFNLKWAEKNVPIIKNVIKQIGLSG